MSIFAPRQRRVLARLYASAKALEEMSGEKVTQRDMDFLHERLNQIWSRLKAMSHGWVRDEVKPTENGKATAELKVDLLVPAELPPKKPRKSRAKKNASVDDGGVELPIKQGDRVTWTGTSGTTYEGEVVLVLPTGMSPSRALAVTKLPTHIDCILDPGGTRTHDSYLVSGNVPDGGSIPRLFWPLGVKRADGSR